MIYPQDCQSICWETVLNKECIGLQKTKSPQCQKIIQ